MYALSEPLFLLQKSLGFELFPLYEFIQSYYRFIDYSMNRLFYPLLGNLIALPAVIKESIKGEGYRAKNGIFTAPTQCWTYAHLTHRQIPQS